MRLSGVSLPRRGTGRRPRSSVFRIPASSQIALARAAEREELRALESVSDSSPTYNSERRELNDSATPATDAPTRTSAYRTLETLVYEDIRASIVGGRYIPGQPLVASKVARELGVSRAPVSVALKRLQYEGFVEGDPHKVITVSSPSLKRVQEIYAMRRVLEGLAARGATTNATAAQKRELRKLAEEMKESTGEQEDRLRLDYRFHRLLREASGMPLLVATLNNLYDHCEYYRALQNRSQPDRQQSLDEHFHIVEALEKKDEILAGRFMEQHLERSLVRLLNRFAATPDVNG